MDQKIREQKVDEILTRGVSEVIDGKNLRKKLLSGKKIRVKLGMDPTSPNLHLGRSVALLKLRDLQELGHHITLLVGDFTGVIGDTSDKESERPMLSSEIVEKNLVSYKEQAGKIIDLDKVDFYYNSEGLKKIGYWEISQQADQFSLSEFIMRDNIRRRLDTGKRISLREVLYPLMQGYDSVVLKTELELGGTDQRFNLLAGRRLQPYYNQEPQDILMVNLLEGIDGRKMSSSWGNTINFSDMPNEMFGKIMSMDDKNICTYLTQCTRVPMEEIKKNELGMKGGTINPRDVKLFLAREIVKIYHSEKEAYKAEEYFVNTFSKQLIPDEVPDVKINNKEVTLVNFLIQANLATSKSDARRKITQGGVSIDGEKLKDEKLLLTKQNHNNKIIKTGKRFFTKIIFFKK